MRSGKKEIISPYIYEKAFEATGCAMVLTNPEGYVIDTNNSFIELWGGSKSGDAIGKHFSAFIKPALVDKPFKTAIKTGENWSGKLKAVHKNGSIFEIYLTVSLIRDDSKRILYGLGTIVDIARQQGVLNQITKQHYSFFTETMHDGYWLVNSSGNIIECNMNACKMLNYSKEELLGKNVSEIETIEGYGGVKSHLAKMTEEGTLKYRTKHRTKDGTMLDVDVISIYWKSHNQFIGFIRNITEQEQLSAQLKTTSKALESLNLTLQMLMGTENSDAEKQKYTIYNTIYRVIFPMVKQLSEFSTATQIEIISTIKHSLESIQVLPLGLSKSLSPVELKISQLIMQGYTSKEIGDIMNVSGRTVENYRQSIRNKLGIKNTSKNLRDTLTKYSSV